MRGAEGELLEGNSGLQLVGMLTWRDQQRGWDRDFDGRGWLTADTHRPTTKHARGPRPGDEPLELFLAGSHG